MVVKVHHNNNKYGCLLSTINPWVNIVTTVGSVYTSTTTLKQNYRVCLLSDAVIKDIRNFLHQGLMNVNNLGYTFKNTFHALEGVHCTNIPNLLSTMFRVILTRLPIESVVNTRKVSLVGSGNCDIRGISDGITAMLWISLPVHVRMKLHDYEHTHIASLSPVLTEDVN